MNVVIDTSVLIGWLVPNDHRHYRARALWEAIRDSGHICIYFDCVTSEAISVVIRRLEEKGISDQIVNLLGQLEEKTPAEVISWITPDMQRMYPEVLGLLCEFPGALNFNDALIALACRERGISAIASFDADFDQIAWLRRLALPEDV